jgi:acetyl esterase/lipase
VIVLPGGAWVTGSKENYGDVGRWLARHGCVAAVASYRLYPEVSYPAFVEDAAAVVAWARASAARWDADPERLYFLGHSAGAQIAALVALDPDFLAAHDLAPSALAGVVGVSGPYDLALKRIGWIDERIADWALMRSARPIGRVRSGAPPMLLIAGGLDPLVPPREAIEFAAALRGAGNRAEVRVVPALGHITVLYGMTWGPATDGIGAEVLRFVSA